MLKNSTTQFKFQTAKSERNFSKKFSRLVLEVLKKLM